MNNAPDIAHGRFTAMTRLDHNRAIAQLAAKTGATVTDITHMTIWGNHSATQYPDLFHAEVDGQNAAELVDDQAWIEGDFIPTVQKRGAAIIEARGCRCAASAANAAIDHVRDWVLGTPEGDWVSMAVPSDGSYGVPEGLISSFPCTTLGRRVLDRPGPRHRRLLPRPDRRLGRRAGRGARRRRRARPDLAGLIRNHLPPNLSPAVARPGDDQGRVRLVADFGTHLGRTCPVRSPVWASIGDRFGGGGGGRRGYLRNLLVVLSASTLPPVWHVAQ